MTDEITPEGIIDMDNMGLGVELAMRAMGWRLVDDFWCKPHDHEQVCYMAGWAPAESLSDAEEVTIAMVEKGFSLLVISPGSIIAGYVQRYWTAIVRHEATRRTWEKCADDQARVISEAWLLAIISTKGDPPHGI
jgi:hypothetical protein